MSLVVILDIQSDLYFKSELGLPLITVGIISQFGKTYIRFGRIAFYHLCKASEGFSVANSHYKYIKTTRFLNPHGKNWD